MSDETPRPPRAEYPTRASLRGRAPAPATRPIDLSNVSDAEPEAAERPGTATAGTSAGSAPAGTGRPFVGRAAARGRASRPVGTRPVAAPAAGPAVTNGSVAAKGSAPSARSAPAATPDTAPSGVPVITAPVMPPATWPSGEAPASLFESPASAPPSAPDVAAGSPLAPGSSGPGDAATTTRSGSRRAAPLVAPDEPLADPQRKLPIAVVALVALIGGLLVAAGVLQGTVFRPATTITASLPKAATQPIVVAEPGMMSLDGPRFQVTAQSSSNTPVFLGIGRASDVQSYLAKVSRLSLTGEDGAGALTSRTVGTEASLPDPAAADVWVVSVRGRGTASLNWPDVGGQWVLVTATDGTAPAPAKVSFTWSGAKPASSGSALIAIGAVLLVSGLVLLLMLVSRARMERST